MARVTVIRNRYVRGWPTHDDGERVHVLDLGTALERLYTTDAHVALYDSPNGRRLTSDALDRDVVKLTAFGIDVDCPTVHGTSEPAPEGWRRETRRKVVALSRRHPHPYYFETRGGARIIYRQAEPTILTSRADAEQWRQHYLIAIAHLQRDFGIDADPACSDWTRLYRLPRVVRSGTTRENYPVWGDPDNIGTFCAAVSHVDVEHAEQSAPAAFGQRRVLEFHPSAATGEGLFFHLLRGRGDVIRPHGRHGHVVRCPNEAQHSSGRTGDGSTVVYPPAAGKELGKIHCKHSHREHTSVRDWLSLFSDGEKDAAREAAGIQRRDRRVA